MTNPRPIGRTVTVAVPTGGLAAGRFGSGLLVVALSLVGCGVIATPAARGDEAGPVRPTWECLPEETTGLVRVPGGRAFVDALVERTRLGGLLFSPERNRRRREQWAEIAAQNPDEAAPWRSLLEYGLEPEDLEHSFDREAGMALVGPGLADGRLTMLVAWMEPGAEPAERMLAGLGRRLAEMVDEVAEEGGTARRTDLEMAGRPVTWVRLPLERNDAEAGARLELGTLHVLATRFGGRLVAAAAAVARRGAINLTMNGGSDGRLKIDTDVADAAGGETDEEATAAAERAAEEAGRIFERILAAHGGAEDPPLARVLDAAGVRGSRPEGVPLVEAIVRPLGFGAAAPDSSVNERLVPYGLDAVGPLVWRQALDGTVWRSHVFVSLPAPRHGVARLLDDPSDPAEVPSFVSREPVGFHSVSLDLGRAYALLREAAFAGDEPPPGNGFGVAETQSLALTGMELPALLSALGTRHVLVSYPKPVDIVAERLRNLMAANRRDAPPPNPNETPLAVVWRVADEAPFQRLLRLVPATAGEVREEQGFRMLRMPSVAIALGQKHLVVAVGDGVAEKTLAAIRTPPPVDAALADGPADRRAREMLPPAPGGLYGVEDHARGGGWLGYSVRLAAAVDAGDAPGRPRADAEDKAARALAALLPSAAEIEGLLGASTVLWRSTDDGILMRSATDLPAP